MDPNTDDMGYVTLLNWKTFSLESKWSQQIYVKAAKKTLGKQHTRFEFFT